MFEHVEGGDPRSGLLQSAPGFGLRHGRWRFQELQSRTTCSCVALSPGGCDRRAKGYKEDVEVHSRCGKTFAVKKGTGNIDNGYAPLWRPQRWRAGRARGGGVDAWRLGRFTTTACLLSLCSHLQSIHPGSTPEVCRRRARSYGMRQQHSFVHVPQAHPLYMPN